MTIKLHFMRTHWEVVHMKLMELMFCDMLWGFKFTGKEIPLNDKGLSEICIKSGHIMCCDHV